MKITQSIVLSSLILSVGFAAHTYKLKNGWNLLGSTEDNLSSSDFSKYGDIVWVYDEGWNRLNIQNGDFNLSKGQGFWFRSNREGNLPTTATTEPTTAPSPTITPTITPTPTVTPTTSANSLINTYKIVDTGTTICYNDMGGEMNCPANSTAKFYGQDGFYSGNQPSYEASGDCVIDKVTGLMWQKGYQEMSFSDAISNASKQSSCGYSDWRVPTIKELYSLILFTGETPTDYNSSTGGIPYLNTNYFDFKYFGPESGSRSIDAQYLTSTKYLSTTMGGDATFFGVNFADGRIKGYPISNKATGVESKKYIKYVRGNENYGKNNFVDNSDGTISDLATSLMWQQSDSEAGYNWEGALSYCEKLTLSNYSDWRLPNSKELHSIVDYTRSPDTTNSPAINSLFKTSKITFTLASDSTLGDFSLTNYPYFWSSTSHLDGINQASYATYFAFGESGGYMQSPNSSSYVLYDVHGAGAQKGDPKKGDTANYTHGFGPQGDLIVINNYVRCVRDIK